MTLLTVLGIASLVAVAVFTWTQAQRAPGVGQSPRSAVIEAWMNIIIGFSINFVANLWLLPLALPGSPLTHSVNFWLGCVYTAISIIRQFMVRRWFNARLHAIAERLA
jgi:hypothetical protein